MTHIINVPGYTNSGPGHWQSLWERDPRFSRIDGVEWERPTRSAWVGAIEREVSRSATPVLLVAHSLGCAGVAHWAAGADPTAVVGAFLVAPADPGVDLLRGIADDFLPLPRKALPFRSLVICSTSDPFVTAERARQLAGWWGSGLIEVGEAGHINAAAGFGSWAEGRKLLEAWLAELDGEQAGC